VSALSSRSLSLSALALAVALTTAACGGEEEPDAAATPSESASADASPAGDVEVPEGVQLSEPGDELGFGDTATVAYQANAQRGTVLGLTVLGVRTGRVQDLSAFQLDAATRASTPYYVRVRVTNDGTEGLGGAAVPLFAVDGRDVLIQPSTFTTDFARCPSGPLPRAFPADAEVTTCLVYLVPEDGEELTAVSYRPLQDLEAITWAGEVQPPPRRGR
jgi:hypothetical protein